MRSVIVLGSLPLAIGCGDPHGSDTHATDTASSDATSVSPDTTPEVNDAERSTPDADLEDATIEDTSRDVVLGDPDVLVGAFQVGLVAPVPETATTSETPGSTGILGKVFDGPTLESVVFHPTTRVGDCTLWLPEVPFCAEGCVGGAVCVAADSCRDHPAVMDVGVVRVSGLRTTTGATDVELTAVGGAYQPRGPSLPYPAFDEGDTITVTASGGDVAPFMIASRGIAPLELTSDALLVARETPLALTWTTPGDPTIATIDVKLDISNHGGTKGVVRCTTVDDGALTIDGALVTALVDLGYSGLPTVVVARRAIGATTIEAGRVELEVSSIVELPVDIPGLVSCTDDAHCPQGQSCQQDLRCQ